MDKVRNYKFDNIKALLIILVVFGHLLEDQIVTYDILHIFYTTIYSFHMPAFIFVAGYFGKLKPRKLLFMQIWPYVIFQLVYTYIMAELVYHIPFRYEIMTAKWIMWYLFVIILYQLLLPFLDTDNVKTQIVAVAGLFIMSLLVGFDESIGMTNQLSRFFIFWPYYMIGYYSHKNSEGIKSFYKKNSFVCNVITFAVIMLGLMYINLKVVTIDVFYGWKSYALGNSNFTTRSVLFALGVAGTAALLIVVPNKKFKLFTNIGKYTLPIYLIHGVIVKYIVFFKVFSYTRMINFLISAASAIVIVLLLGNKYANTVFEYLFTGKWVMNLLDKNTKKADK